MVLPPNVSEADFNAALGEFRSAVGASWVFSSDEDVALYRDSYSINWGEPEERVASAAVAPAKVEEVQQIVRTANRYRIPLYPISTGRNLTYGGSAPNMRGSVVVDLKRMNRILEVDEKRAFALVEPGVSYFDLYHYIRERNLKLMLDVPDPGWGSPMGNSLDHGAGYTMAAFRDHFGSHCGMEVVTPDGDVIRTGMGAVPNSDSWQDFRYGAGPNVDGLFAQSNFGIVTKMGFWLMPMPEAFLSGTVTAPRHQDLDATGARGQLPGRFGPDGDASVWQPRWPGSVWSGRSRHGELDAKWLAFRRSGRELRDGAEASCLVRAALFLWSRKKPFAPHGKPPSGVSARPLPARRSRTANS